MGNARRRQLAPTGFFPERLRLGFAISFAKLGWSRYPPPPFTNSKPSVLPFTSAGTPSTIQTGGGASLR
jgi:hypothetical protein